MDNKTVNYFLSFALYLAMTFALAACGGGSDEEDSNTEDQNQSPVSLDEEPTGPVEDPVDAPSQVYIAVRAVNFDEETSGFSNEIPVLAQRDANVTVSFSEPNLQVDGNCLTSQINRYVVHYGNGPGAYSEEIAISRNSTALNCQVVGIHPICGDLTNCSVTITL